jgi:4-alpha-glucanotransferase
MTWLTFQIEYGTTWGQQVCICGSTPELGNFDERKALELIPVEGNIWTSTLCVSDISSIEYYYFIREGKTSVRHEWGLPRCVHLAPNLSFDIVDHWRDVPYHQYLYSSVFTESVFFRTKQTFIPQISTESVLLNVVCPYVEKNQLLVISGEGETLGNWDLKKSVPFTFVGDGQWQLLLNAAELKNSQEYKFVIVRQSDNEVVKWEDGENRKFPSDLSFKEVYVENSIAFRYSFYNYKGTGVAIPVFSLRSNDSFGIGDFLDLKKMIDWATMTGMHIIQILPINDTTATKTWRDSYPYSAISVHALHPLYLGMKEHPLRDKSENESYLREAKVLNGLDRVDYEAVLNLKFRYYRELFAQEFQKISVSNEYRKFYENNKEWLFAYSCYCYLRDKYHTVRFAEWGSFAEYDPNNLQLLLDSDLEAKNEFDFNNFIQFLLHRQLTQVKEYAHLKGVALKGDIPIGINRNSVDAWTNARLFNMDTQTGAPPDDFAVEGQNWGFPTYNWRAMEEEHFDWWKKRFTKMSDYFDAYRIDHILGFFRIWEIPIDAVNGLLGHFSPALPYYPEEIRRAGIPFDEDRMTKPFIREEFLSDFFGEFAEEVKMNYLQAVGEGSFRLREECNSQLKIKNLFPNVDTAKNKRIRDGLMALCAEVLFVRDRIEFNKFHPRITAQYTYSFRYLDDNTKNAFNRLYDDFFYRRHNYFWREQAMKKLPELISSTSMLACGEDLGMVPDCVPSVMNELKILSLEIQRMPKNPHVRFSDLAQLPYLSVCTTSTHDMSPIRAWWKENREVTQTYFNSVLHLQGPAPEECTPDLCKTILQKHLDSTAMWVILPWQDWMSIDEALRNPNDQAERINVPANPDHYWCYKMHLSLEKLLQADSLNSEIGKMSTRNR